MAAIIEVVDLIKHFPGVKAVDGLSFAIPAGCCFGLLGPNGAADHHHRVAGGRPHSG